MSDFDVSMCKYYLKDGSCSSMNEDCVKCVHNYCDWKVNQEQFQQLKVENEELKSKNKDLINANIGQHKFIKKQQQKLEKIKRFCINKEEARLLYGCVNFDFYEIVKIIES